jgi:TrmH family RNA methyltransferase
MTKLPLLSENKQKLLRKTHQKKYRNQLDLYNGEGYRLLTAAFDNPGTKILQIILNDKVIGGAQGAQILRTAAGRKIPVYRSTEHQMQRLSMEVTPPGIFFTVAKSPSASRKLQTASERIIVFLEQISDAGNLGTILRSMVWFGITSIILSPGCVDVYNPKVVRASAGAIFAASIFTDIPLNQAVSLLKPQEYQIVGAIPQGGQTFAEIKFKNRILLVFGSEASGLSESAQKLLDRSLTIPRQGNMESLNLAVSAGIIFYHMTNYATT